MLLKQQKWSSQLKYHDYRGFALEKKSICGEVDETRLANVQGSLTS